MREGFEISDFRKDNHEVSSQSKCTRLKEGQAQKGEGRPRIARTTTHDGGKGRGMLQLSNELVKNPVFMTDKGVILL